MTDDPITDIEQNKQFTQFEDELELLLARYFPNGGTATKTLALSVALGDFIGARTTIPVAFILPLVMNRIRLAAEAQRTLATEVAKHTTTTTTAKH